jgi:hypothetical protein
MLKVSKMIPVHIGECGFKEQVPKVSISKNMKIHEKEIRSGYFPFLLRCKQEDMFTLQ